MRAADAAATQAGQKYTNKLLWIKYSINKDNNIERNGTHKGIDFYFILFLFIIICSVSFFANG